MFAGVSTYLWQNVVGAFLVPPAGSHRWQVVGVSTYLWQNVVGVFLVPPLTELTRRHFDRRDSGVEKSPAIEK